MNQPPQRLVFTYHKSGTVLFEHVMARIARRVGLRIATQYGLVTAIDPRADIIIIAHSLLAAPPGRPLLGVRIIRDPRDIWVSSYLYHRHCHEGWCVNTDTSPTGPTTYPRLDFSMQHRPTPWKRDYLSRLAGESYQQNLLNRDQAAGLLFELAGYTGATLEAMAAWQNLPGVLDIKLEDVAAAFDATMLRIVRHLGFSETDSAAAVACVADEDVARMDHAAIAANPHIHGRKLSKWRDVLDLAQVALFEHQHGNLIQRLGYERVTPASLTWRPTPRMPVTSHASNVSVV